MWRQGLVRGRAGKGFHKEHKSLWPETVSQSIMITLGLTDGDFGLEIPDAPSCFHRLYGYSCLPAAISAVEFFGRNNASQFCRELGLRSDRSVGTGQARDVP